MYGLANYETNSWEATLTQNPATERVMSITAPYRSPGGFTYVFVATNNLQQITVNEVGLDLEIVGWSEVGLSFAGSTSPAPAIDFTLTDNPAIAYINSANGSPFFIVATARGTSCRKARGRSRRSTWRRRTARGSTW
jgi:hypothetical protein